MACLPCVCATDNTSSYYKQINASLKRRNKHLSLSGLSNHGRKGRVSKNSDNNHLVTTCLLFNLYIT
ncbi:hypothetical protein VNO78_15483 [Psophocarpus tetragonolobus]|uniref:Uncharacterized protein n=1 Tax=Psophocarpus tetragonolobus TaxID=3891 RepID=A0AAN9SF28_PSOTE